MAVLLIEHDVKMLMETCDRITVIAFGVPICEGTPEQVSSDAAVIAAYLGQPAEEVEAKLEQGGVVQSTSMR
jgi:ABC-type branched-subunit amino acid transport system ATPase component